MPSSLSSFLLKLLLAKSRVFGKWFAARGRTKASVTCRSSCRRKRSGRIQTLVANRYDARIVAFYVKFVPIEKHKRQERQVTWGNKYNVYVRDDLCDVVQNRESGFMVVANNFFVLFFPSSDDGGRMMSALMTSASDPCRCTVCSRMLIFLVDCKFSVKSIIDKEYPL